MFDMRVYVSLLVFGCMVCSSHAASPSKEGTKFIALPDQVLTKSPNVTNSLKTARTLIDCLSECGSTPNLGCKAVSYQRYTKQCEMSPAIAEEPSAANDIITGNMAKEVFRIKSGVYNCQSPNIINEMSQTCMRLVTTPMTWHDAKADCESNGETLLVLETAELSAWFRDQYMNVYPAEWGVHIWLGAYMLDFDSKIYQWQGRVKTIIPESEWDWHVGHGWDVNAYCVYMHGTGWDAHGLCTVLKAHICES